ncbi:MAG: hypothetical protein ABSF28_07160 [Terracidiphilus sp.]|jgi:hypothetical protein
MGAWLGLEGPDIFAYMVSDVLGMLVFFWLRPTSITLAITASIFVSFHLFLAWLVVTADHETGFSLPVVSTIVTHLSCLVIVYLCSALIAAISASALFLPIYLLLPLRPIRYILALCIPGLAIFERYWLFSGGVKKKEVPLTPEAQVLAAETAAVADAATANDYDDWLQFVARQKPPFPKPGSSLKVEYERWLLARAKTRAAAPSNIKQA